jgi:hypothetical protein
VEPPAVAPSRRGAAEASQIALGRRQRPAKHSVPPAHTPVAPIGSQAPPSGMRGVAVKRSAYAPVAPPTPSTNTKYVPGGRAASVRVSPTGAPAAQPSSVARAAQSRRTYTAVSNSVPGRSVVSVTSDSA